MATIKPNTNKFSLSWKVYDLIKQTDRAELAVIIFATDLSG